MDGLKKTLLFLRSPLGRYALQIVRYTWLKESLDRPYRQKLETRRDAPGKTPGLIQKTRAIPGGARFNFENAALEVIFLAPDLLRVSWEPGKTPLPYAIERNDWPEAPVRIEEVTGGWRCSAPGASGAPELQVQIRGRGEILFRNARGELLRAAEPPEWSGSADDPAWKCTARLRPEERLYGLGEHAMGLNLRGTRHRMVNTDPTGSYGPGAGPLYMHLPVYAGLHNAGSYLIFYENSYPANFSFDPHNKTGQPSAPAYSRAEFSGGMLRYYLIPGPLQHALERFSELTGRPPLPPLWSLGYHQSRWGYMSSGEIRQVAAGFAEHDLPVSAIHLDIDYMDGFRVFTVDEERFPDLAALAQELGTQNIKIVTILDPGVKQDSGYSMYQEGLQKDYFVTLPDGRPLVGIVWPGLSVFPDFTNREARLWWGGQYRRLLAAGSSGFWHDMNEPTALTSSGDHALPMSARHSLEGCGGDHRQARNLYALQMNRAGYEALNILQDGRRPWLLSRSGWVSQQRYAWKWTGDVESSWASLRMTIAEVIGTGLSGIPYNGPDIGGFSGDPSAELYLRWFQMATFLPFFRTHSALTTRRREPWSFGEPYTGIIRQFLHLRYKLLPYLYTLAWQASQTGQPLVRPLFWDHPGRSDLWDVDDAFLLGNSLLIAPILEPGATQRTISLPPGCWYDLWQEDGEERTFQGPGEIQVPASLERIPVLVSAGSLLPIQEGQRLTLHLYLPPAARGANNLPPYTAGTLYQDSGDGYGSWRVDRYWVRLQAGQITVDCQSEGEFSFPYVEAELQLHGARASQARVDDNPMTIQNNRIPCGSFKEMIIEAENQ